MHEPTNCTEKKSLNLNPWHNHHKIERMAIQ